MLEQHANPSHVQQTQALPTQDVVVIGGGPAGVSAAIYTARKGLKVTMIADRLGGQVKDTVSIENLISVPHTTGSELTGALHQHIKDYPITVKEHVQVEQIQQGQLKTVHLSSGEVINTRSLILATGAQWRTLGVAGEQEYKGRGVAYCPHCDGPFFKGKPVAVVGGGNSGIEAALDLAKIVKSVTVLEFASTLKADQVLQDQAYKTPNIEIITNASVQEVLGNEEHVNALQYQDQMTQQQHQLKVSGIFVQIGLQPNSTLVKDLVTCSKQGEIAINEQCETSAAGIFACGDVTTVPYKQIIIAMGEGAKAGLSAFEYLLLQKG